MKPTRKARNAAGVQTADPGAPGVPSDPSGACCSSILVLHPGPPGAISL